MARSATTPRTGRSARKEGARQRRPNASAPRSGSALACLPRRLRDIGYTADTLLHCLHARSPDDVGVLNHAVARERVAREESPAATALRLFFLEDEESARNVRNLFSRAELKELEAAGVVDLAASGDDRYVRARVRIDVVGDQYVVADRRFRPIDRGALGLRGRDPVYPASSDSLLLRDCVVAPPAGRVLDLCTGSGIQAMHSAGNAETVVAVDINPRAVAMARTNAEMNGIGNVDVRLGDLYDPVRREQFDLILANPPFVTSPYAGAPSYHSARTSAQKILRKIVDGWRHHLRPGGRAFAISHLALYTGEETETVTARWFRNFPGRVLVLVLETGTPIDLAAAQALFALERGLSAYAAEVRRWVDYLHRRHIKEVKLLLLVVERGTRRSFDVVDAHARVFPMPLTPPPASRIGAWLGKNAAT